MKHMVLEHIQERLRQCKDGVAELKCTPSKTIDECMYNIDNTYYMLNYIQGAISDLQYMLEADS
jgi:hypothetical protein